MVAWSIVSRLRSIIMASIGSTFQMSTKDPLSLMTLAFKRWYGKNTTTELEYDLFLYWVGMHLQALC